MKPETYYSLTEVEREELRTVGAGWSAWALRSIGVNGDYWNGLQLREDAGMWQILYQSKETPFRTRSRNVGEALIEDAQMNLSKL